MSCNCKESNNDFVVEYKALYSDVAQPVYQTSGSAGCDVHAYIKSIGNRITIKAGETKIIPTGITLAIPKNFMLDVRPRSGVSVKTKLRISNSPGTVDSDYRKEIGIIIDNIGQTDEIIQDGDRIAQFVFLPVVKAVFKYVDNLDVTGRIGGFGSTGKS